LVSELDPTALAPLPANGRDVREIGHYGTGDLELTIRSNEEAEAARSFIRSAFEEVGG